MTFGQNEIAKFLLIVGADPLLRDGWGKSSKDHALIQGNEEIVELINQLEM